MFANQKVADIPPFRLFLSKKVCPGVFTFMEHALEKRRRTDGSIYKRRFSAAPFLSLGAISVLTYTVILRQYQTVSERSNHLDQ